MIRLCKLKVDGGRFTPWAHIPDRCRRCGESIDQHEYTVEAALRRAHQDGKIKCDRIEFYEKAENAPVALGPNGRPGAVVGAWRGEDNTFVWVADQLLEQSDQNWGASPVV